MSIPSRASSVHFGAGLVSGICGAGLLLLLGCAADGHYIVVGTALAPSSSGVFEADGAGDGNTKVSVHLDYLHPPARLHEGLTTFVVWFVPAQGKPVRGGELKYDSAARTGDLTATSPFTEFVVKVTAERDSRPASPSDYAIAMQEIALD